MKSIDSITIASVEVTTPDDLEPIVARISTLEAICAAQAAHIGRLETRVSAVESDTAALENADAAAQVGLTSLTTGIAAIEADSNAIHADIVRLRDDIELLNAVPVINQLQEETVLARLNRPGLPRTCLLSETEVAPGAAPQAPVISLSTYGTNYITISWPDVSGATSYKVYRDGSLISSSATSPYQFTGLSESTSYSLTAKASNSYGDSVLSNTVTQTTAGSGGRSLLAAGDITYLGKYRVGKHIGVGQGGGELQYGYGFSHRYVGGQLRFLTYGYIGGGFHLNEFAKPSSYDDTVSAVTNAWSNQGTIGWQHGIWWDEEEQRLWRVKGVDYPDAELENNRWAISTIRLGSGGATSGERGLWGLTGIPDRRIMGGVCRIPTWFQSQHSVGKYAIGFGGYASRMAVNTVSLGLSLYAIPDPEDTNDNTLLPSFHTLSDHSSGTTESDSQALISLDRGVRSLSVSNEYDSGHWNQVYSDGYRRWCWGDTAANTGCWIDNDAGTRSKHGFIIVPALSTGRAWYQTSTLNCESRGSEIQIFNPTHFAEVKAGTRQPWQVQPVSIKNITDLITGHTAATAGHNRPGCVEGASFDALTSILYVYCTFSTVNNYDSTIYAFQVGGA